MTENDEQGAGFHRAPPGAIPPFEAAIDRYQDPAKQALIQTVAGGDELEWNYWKATIEFGRRARFDGILDFFVNLPSLQGKFTDESVTGQWYWHEIGTVALDTKFYYRPEVLALLRTNAGPDALIREGWLVHYEDGRIDTETTWADTSHLIATNGYYAYIRLYMWIIH